MYLSDDLSAGLAMVSVLTTRESAILAMLAEGMDNKTIARQLGIREATVKAHMTAILTKLGVTSRLQAGLVAFAACLDGQLGPGLPHGDRGRPGAGLPAESVRRQTAFRDNRHEPCAT